jgi:hypothetical protein
MPKPPATPFIMQKPWLFPIYTLLGIPLGICIGSITGGVNTTSPEALILAVCVIAAINVWFFAFARPKFWRDRKNAEGSE